MVSLNSTIRSLSFASTHPRWQTWLNHLPQQLITWQQTSQYLLFQRAWHWVLSKRFNLSIEDPRFTKLINDYLGDWSNWKQIGELPMRFNGLIVLMARCFHASTGLFGKNANDGRLTQHFEIYL